MPTPESRRIRFLRLAQNSSLRNEISTLGVLAALLELDARVHVLGVLAEDDDVHLLGLLHRAGHALVVLHRPHAGVEVEDLAQRHVQRTNAAADRRGQRSFDGDAQIARRGDRVVGQPAGELAEGFFAGKDLKPADGALAAVGLFDCGVEDSLRGLPDVAAGAVAFNKRNDGIVGDCELPVRSIRSAGRLWAAPARYRCFAWFVMLLSRWSD